MSFLSKWRIFFFVGKVEGRVVWPPRGKYGFGYDAIFEPLNMNKTFGK